ncbi:MAG TPA: hypothetical protein VNR59_11685 [Gaiellaceae bacterium]|nr:hypothetical protein [Gaiellaceae bacterium]
MASVGFVEALTERVHDVVARSGVTGARSLVLVDASRYARRDETYVPRCAWCGKFALGGSWVERGEVPHFMVRVLGGRTTDGICPACFADQIPGTDHEISVHAQNKQTADRLVLELQEYAVRQRSDHVLALNIPSRDAHFVAHLLSRLADCVETNQLDPVQVKIGRHSYLFTGR